MDIAVYGGSGFIGSNYVNLTKNVPYLVPRNVRQAPVKQILYFIGTTDNYNIFTDPLIDVRTNIELLIEILEANRQNNPNFVFNYVSSWFVYGNSPLPFHEDNICKPQGFYSISKFAAELFLISYCKTYSINYRILRLGNVYGPGDLGVSKKKNALQFLIRNLRDNQTIELYEGGNVIRDYIHVADVVSAIDLVIDKSDLDRIVNISTGIPTKMKDIIELAKEKLHSHSPIRSIDTPEFHKIVQVKDSLLDIAYLTSLGFRPRFNLEHEILNL